VILFVWALRLKRFWWEAKLAIDRRAAAATTAAPGGGASGNAGGPVATTSVATAAGAQSGETPDSGTSSPMGDTTTAAPSGGAGGDAGGPVATSSIAGNATTAAPGGGASGDTGGPVATTSVATAAGEQSGETPDGGASSPMGDATTAQGAVAATGARKPGQISAQAVFHEFLTCYSFVDLLVQCFCRSRPAANIITDWLAANEGQSLSLPGEFFIGTSAGGKPTGAWAGINLGDLDSAACNGGSIPIGWFTNVYARVAQCSEDGGSTTSLEGQFARLQLRGGSYAFVLTGDLRRERRDLYQQALAKDPPLPPAFHHRCFSSVVALVEPHKAGCRCAAAQCNKRKRRNSF
jgi:hypothetical protein